MIRIIIILLLFLNTFLNFSQCENCDIKLSSSSSKNYVIKNQKLCISKGIYSGKITMGANAKISISADARFEGEIKINGANADILNLGTMDFDNLTVNNSSSLTSSGTIIMDRLKFNDKSRGKISGKITASNLIIMNSSSLTLSGVLEFNNITVKSKSSLLAFHGSLSGNNFNIDAIFHSSVMTYAHRNININDSGNCTFLDQFSIDGNVNNNGVLNFYNSGVISGNFVNRKYLTVSGQTKISNDFINAGVVFRRNNSTCGGFKVLGKAINKGEYGLSGRVSLCPRFDIQNGKVGLNSALCFTCLNKQDTIPVTFLNIEAKYHNGLIQVQWSTAGEKKTHLFQILYSIDGIQFYPFQNVNAKGSKTSIEKYRTVIFPNKRANTHYIKIREINLNGTHTETFPILIKSHCSEYQEYKNYAQTQNNRVFLKFADFLYTDKPVIKNK